MGFNEITAWYPSIDPGGSTDDAYNVGGATNLANTLDTTQGQNAYSAGGTNFATSTFPTIAELNDNTKTHGLNQVIGYLNNRIQNWNAIAGTSTSSLSYVNQWVKPISTDFTSVLTAINSQRLREGWQGGSLTFPNSTPTSGQKIFGYHLAFLRKALAISGTIKVNLPSTLSINYAASSVNHFSNYARNDTPTYNTSTFETDGLTLNGSDPTIIRWGKVNISTQMDRYRILPIVLIPTFVTTAPASATLTLNIATSVTTLESNASTVWAATPGTFPPTLGTGYNGTAYDFHQQFSNSFTPSVGSNAVSFTNLSSILNYTGGKMIMIVAQNFEHNNTGAGISGTNHSYCELNTTANTHSFQMVF